MSKVLGGAALLMAIALAFTWRQNMKLSEALGAAELSIQQAEVTNEENLSTIMSLQVNLSTCVDQRRVDEQQNQTTIIELRRDIEELEGREQEVRIVREEIFRDPSCAELGAIDIGAACPALGVSLFDRANDLN